MVAPITKPPVNILLVDDQPAKLLSYESVLGELGENLVRANSGNEALDLLLRQEFAVVLVDVVMPELDGFELAKLIRSHPRFQKTAIILVSGVMVEDAYRLKGYNSGAVDYISVPIVPEILRAKVAVFAELYRKTNELEQLNRELERRVAERTEEIEAAAAAAVDARREAERANQLKDEFLATLSHELRTPLNAITGWTHLLISGGLDAAEQAKAFDVIQRNALAQARLMADLLDVSRIVSGKLRLDLQPLDLSGAVEAALESLRPTAAAKQIQVGARLTPGLKPVQGDQVRLQQVIWNLLSNAVKFTPEGGHVELSLKPTANNHGAELSVVDDGPGIPPEFLPFIFDRFRQSDHSSTRSQRGLGLGLTIVRHLVEAHGGYVTARNRGDGPGAIFTAVFPLAAADLPLSPGSSPPPFVLQSALHRARVLVVDDEADAREVVARILDTQGAEVMVAASAAEAMVILKRELPNVVVSDIEMPGEDGYDLVRQIRALSRRRGGQTPVAALTAYAGAHDRIKLLEAGFQEHVPKPVQAPELIRVVAMLAARSPQPVAARSKS